MASLTEAWPLFMILYLSIGRQSAEVTQTYSLVVVIIIIEVAVTRAVISLESQLSH